MDVREVAAFLDERYGDNYKVYNLCSERVYKGDDWFDGRGRVPPLLIRYFSLPVQFSIRLKRLNVILLSTTVARWPVDDHNVPSVSEMVSFVDEVKAWLAQSSDNVIAVHCKGGKGRTGTMIWCEATAYIIWTFIL